VSYYVHLPVIWIYLVSMLFVGIVTFNFLSLAGDCAAFYLVARSPIAVCLLLTLGLLWLLGAFLPVDLQALAA
jgi:hypothetical protein